LDDGPDGVVAGFVPGVDGEDYFCVLVGGEELLGEGVHR
jgi:hypothetical protein